MGAVAHLRQAMLDAEHHQRLARRRSGRRRRGPAVRPGARGALAGPARRRAGLVGGRHSRRDPPGPRPGRGVRDHRRDRRRARSRQGRRSAESRKASPSSSGSISPRSPRSPPRRSTASGRRPSRTSPCGSWPTASELWKEQVATAAALAKAGVPFAFATEGLERLDRFPAQLRELDRRGPVGRPGPGRAHASRPRRIAGLDRRLGTLEPGKLGHLVAFSAPFQDEKAKAHVRARRRAEVRDQAGRAGVRGRPAGIAARAGPRGESRPPPTGGRDLVPATGAGRLQSPDAPSRPSSEAKSGDGRSPARRPVESEPDQKPSPRRVRIRSPSEKPRQTEVRARSEAGREQADHPAEAEPDAKPAQRRAEAGSSRPVRRRRHRVRRRPQARDQDRRQRADQGRDDPDGDEGDDRPRLDPGRERQDRGGRAGREGAGRG